MSSLVSGPSSLSLPYFPIIACSASKTTAHTWYSIHGLSLNFEWNLALKMGIRAFHLLNCSLHSHHVPKSTTLRAAGLWVQISTAPCSQEPSHVNEAQWEARKDVWGQHQTQESPAGKINLYQSYVHFLFLFLSVDSYRDLANLKTKSLICIVLSELIFSVVISNTKTDAEMWTWMPIPYIANYLIQS